MIRGINKTMKKSGDGKVRLRYRGYVYYKRKVVHIGYYKTEDEAMKHVAHARWLMDIGVWEYQDASENGELRLI